MPWLCELPTKDGPLAVAIGGGTAWRLAQALILGEPPGCDAALLAGAIARDPALALWSVLQAEVRSAGPCDTVGELANWLAGQALDDWLAKAPLANVASHAATAERLAELAVRSLAVARLAARLAAEQGGDAERAYLVGLLHLARAWLAASGADEDVLPAWLRGALDGIAAGEAGAAAQHGATAACVAQAISLVGRADWAAEAGLDRAAHETEMAADRADWTRGVPGDLLPRLAAKLARLASLENQFQETLETAKLEAVKELAYGAGHEINNPLANISARAQTLLRTERDPERRRMLAAINAQAFRAHEMIADMMLFARPPRPARAGFDLVELARGVCDELGEQAGSQQTKIRLLAPASPVEMSGDRAQLAVALRALCVNALEALVSGGQIDVTIEAEGGGESVCIRVADDGPGIEPLAREHAFDPFYSGREAGRGLGLGLSKCWQIVRQHAGRVEVARRDPQGAVFSLMLPKSNGA